MPKQFHTASTVDFEAIIAKKLIKAEFKEHAALTARLVELAKALAEEYTVSELVECVSELEQHPKAWLAMRTA
jgi:hypothetical protein